MTIKWTNILKAPKKKTKVAKRTSTAYKGQQVIQTYEGKFVPAYKKWKRQCESAKSGTPKMGTSGATQPNLFQFALHHVNDSLDYGKVRRPNSPNANKSGATEIVLSLEKIAKGEKIAEVADVKKLRIFKRKLERMKENVDLNPANIPFTTPEDIVGGRAKYPKKPNTFGHYRTPLYNKLAARKEGQTAIKVPSSYYSANRDFSARPPLYQALFGDGGVVSEGLLDVITLAVEELDGADNFVIIRQLRKPGELAEIPAVKTEVAKILKNPQSNDSNTGELLLGKMAKLFEAIQFPITSKQEENYVRSAAGIQDLEGEIEGFQVQISGQVFERLIKEVFGSQLGRKRSAGGFYIHSKNLDFRPRVNGQPINHPRDKNKNTEDVQKSWVETLWHGN